MSPSGSKHSPLPSSPSATLTPERHDFEDSRSLHSLDLEEAKAMLRDAPEHAALMEPSRSGRIRRLITPCSIVLNLVLFLAILLVLSNPCSVSSRKCVYRRDSVALMGDFNRYVPECTSFTYESLVANSQMLTGDSQIRTSNLHERLQIRTRRNVRYARGTREDPSSVGKGRSP